MCSGKGCVGSSEEISTNDEVASHELKLSLRVMVITTEVVQMEKLGVGVGELGVGRMGGGEVKVGMLAAVFVVD